MYQQIEGAAKEKGIIRGVDHNTEHTIYGITRVHMCRTFLTKSRAHQTHHTHTNTHTRIDIQNVPERDRRVNYDLRVVTQPTPRHRRSMVRTV